MNIRTNPRFWDCECKKRYIHVKAVKHCIRCDVHQDNMPDSKMSEIRLSNIAPDSHISLRELPPHPE